MGSQHDLADVLLAQESGEERCWVGARPQQTGICAIAVAIVGVCGRCILACMACKTIRKEGRKGGREEGRKEGRKEDVLDIQH